MILIALGANLPAPSGATPLDTCRAAARQLAGLPGLRLIATSRWYRTAAVPASDQPDFVNGVVALEGPADPAGLLALLHAIEAAAGRTRTHPDAPRALDLDIIDLHGIVRDAPDPILPHPRAHQRGFVLHPLADVAPGWVHPRLDSRIDQLIARLPAEALCIVSS